MKGKSRPEMNERLGVVIICCLFSLDSESSYLHIGCSWNTSHLGGLLIRITAIAIPLHSSYKHFYYYYSISYLFTPPDCYSPESVCSLSQAGCESAPTGLCFGFGSAVPLPEDCSAAPLLQDYSVGPRLVGYFAGPLRQGCYAAVPLHHDCSAVPLLDSCFSQICCP